MDAGSARVAVEVAAGLEKVVVEVVDSAVEVEEVVVDAVVVEVAAGSARVAAEAGSMTGRHFCRRRQPTKLSYGMISERGRSYV